MQRRVQTGTLRVLSGPALIYQPDTKIFGPSAYFSGLFPDKPQRFAQSTLYR
jgi:hypothetical protein